MNRIGVIVTNVAVALYLFASGILGFNNGGVGINFTNFTNPFRSILTDILGRGDFTNVLIIVLSICAIVAGVLLLLALFKIEVPITDLIMVIFICIWLVIIVLADIIHPLNKNHKFEFLTYLLQLSAHLMVLGALVTSTKRFGGRS